VEKTGRSIAVEAAAGPAEAAEAAGRSIAAVGAAVRIAVEAVGRNTAVRVVQIARSIAVETARNIAALGAACSIAVHPILLCRHRYENRPVARMQTATQADAHRHDSQADTGSHRSSLPRGNDVVASLSCVGWNRPVPRLPKDEVAVVRRNRGDCRGRGESVSDRVQVGRIYIQRSNETEPAQHRKRKGRFEENEAAQKKERLSVQAEHSKQPDSASNPSSGGLRKLHICIIAASNGSSMVALGYSPLIAAESAIVIRVPSC